MLRPFGKLIGILLLLAFLAIAPARANENLSRLIQGVKESSARGKRPVVVLDIDDTLVDSRYRSAIIYREASEDSEFSRRYPAYARRLAAILPREVFFNHADTMRRLGIEDEEAIARLDTYWKSKFFTSGYLTFDHAVQGASGYANALIRAGARIIYLTGRDRPRMGEGTKAALERKRFPLGGDAKLAMKPDLNMSDIEFKNQALGWIRKQGEVLAVFENEPANLNLLREAFPEAEGFLVDSIHSDKPDRPLPGTHHIKNFLKARG